MTSPTAEAQDTLAARIEALLAQMSLQEKVELLAGADLWHTVPNKRLGIPSIVMTDGPHGVRADDDNTGRKVAPATSFPTGISMGASWNPALIERVGAALAEETRYFGCDVLLGPCVNIVRSPLGGRNFETYSEDPFHAGRIGAGWVKGLQGKQVGASLKHFAANNQEIERHRGSSVVDERTLREIYLPAFEHIVKETQPWTVMCSYNRINGIYASENRYLLTEILRDEWGFEGAVVSDWGAVHSTVDPVEAGLDIEMPGPARWFGDLLVEAVNTWQLDEEVIDQAARRVLKLVFLSGRMDGDVPAGKGDCPEHRALAQELAEESITLLKNDGALLPFKLEEVKSIAVIGPNAAEARYGGGGSSFVRPVHTISPLEGIRAKAGGKVKVDYALGCSNQVSPPTAPAEYFPGGLKAEFFDGPDFAGKPAGAVTWANVDRFWFNASPFEGLSVQSFSARISGKLRVPASGAYTFILGGTELSRVYLDGKLLAENDVRGVDLHSLEGDVNRASTRALVELEAGKSYEFMAEYSKDSMQRICGIRLLMVPPQDKTPEQLIAEAAELARRSDVAVVFAGMPTFFESEGGDRANMQLPGPQAELIRAVAAANPRTVVVVNAGAPVALPWADDVPSILEAYYPGQENGAAMANILFGEVNPSGKLPVSFPARLEDNPAYGNYPGLYEVHYGEGILVGYRWYDARDIAPQFPFGHGLSYTTFEFSDLKVAPRIKPDEDATVTVKISNTGKLAGSEVAQLYVADRQSTLARPPKELKGFEKVYLQPGESKTLSFTLDQRALSFYDPYISEWVAEPGEFEVLVGSSSRDIRVRAGFVLE